MPREKNKLTYQALEEHAIYWVTDQLEDLKETATNIYLDQSIVDEEKEFIYNGLARQVSNLIELMHPLRHDEQSLLEWAQEFVNEYETFEKGS